jgi:MFS family permease
MAFFKKDELKLLWPFYFDAIIVTMLFLYPIFYLLYMKEIGLSLTQIGFLGSSYALASILFEIPTGAIADIFGRKFSTILGQFLTGLIMISIMFFQSFYWILGLFFLRGFAWTLTSGADEAWIVDLLKHKKKNNLIHEYYSKRHSFISFGMVAAGIVGAVLVKYFGLWIIWPVTGGSMILTSIVFLFGEENFVRKKQHVKKHINELINHTKDSIKYSARHEVISLLLMIGMITMIITVLTSEITWYPYLQGLGFQDHWFGYLVSASFVFGIFIPYFTKSLSKKLGGYKKYLILMLIIQAIILFAVGFTNILLIAVMMYLLFMTTYDFYGPVKSTFFQKFVPSKMRATIGSSRNMLNSLVVIFAFPLVGFIADNIGPQYTILLGAFILIPAIILYSKINYKEKRK